VGFDWLQRMNLKAGLCNKVYEMDLKKIKILLSFKADLTK